jgi:hypothetical protein
MSKFFHYDKKTGKVVEGRARCERHTGDYKEFDCYALGVHPAQISDLRKHLDCSGCRDVEISREGDPRITSESQYRRVRKAMNVHPNNSFTSR